MAVDFIQERKDISLNYSLHVDTEPMDDSSKATRNPSSSMPNFWCGELVKPGFGPGVLVGKTRVWRNEKEVVTEVDGLFPAGAVDYITPSTFDLVQPSLAARAWGFVCSATMLTFGMGAKFVLKGLNTTIVHGKENIDCTLDRDSSKSLLSVINHQSCFDDPGIWGAILSPHQLVDKRTMRWGASASEVIFINKVLATFFSLGKVVPIVRGWGVHQPAMDFLLARLNGGGWVNIFPEGKVNADGGFMRYKWGVGRLAWDCATPPILLPVVHLGMDTVLPNPKEGEEQSVRMRFGNLVTVNIGTPVDLEVLVERLRLAGMGAMDARITVTKEVQDIMSKLYIETKEKHLENIKRWLARWHDEQDVVPSILT